MASNFKLPPKYGVPLGIIVLGIAYALYQVHDYRSTRLSEMEGKTKAIEATRKGKEGELQRLQDFVSNIENIKAELRELNAREEKSLESMPATFNLSALLRRFTLLANNTGIELAFFKPRNDETKAPGSFYSSQTIELQFNGAFTETLLFMDQLSRLKRIINIESISMVVGQKPNLGAVPTATKAVVRAYRFSE